MKFYLAGPMASLPQHNFPAFQAACLDLRGRGLDLVSPHEIDHGDTPETRGIFEYSWYMRNDFRVMLDCDAVILLPGWTNSLGAKYELILADILDMKVFYYKGLGVDLEEVPNPVEYKVD